MKKAALLLLLGAMTMTLFGCAGNRYHVDYHGQKDFFKGAKDSYAAGQRVVLKYDLIATDTDYSFSVIGADYTSEWKSGAYVIRFTMPENDVEVCVGSYNTMVRQDYDMEPSRMICLVRSEEAFQIPEGAVSMEVTDYYDGEYLTVMLRNRTDAAYTLPETCSIALMISSQFPMQGAWDEAPLTLLPGEKAELFLNLEPFGGLAPGAYQILTEDGLTAQFSLAEEWTE